MQMLNFNNAGKVKNQYGTSENLDIRMLLHQLYSTNKFGWSRWVFDNYLLGQSQHVLELGCGTGAVWAEKQNNLRTMFLKYFGKRAALI